MPIYPFQIKIPEEALINLRSRIVQTRWPDEIENSGWHFGAGLSYMRELADYWANKFNWRKIENDINNYPNFIAEIDGCRIHFLHIKGGNPDSIPIILLHGWPGSFLEMMKLIPLLTENFNLTFNLVIPSLMGYGFSQKITGSGCNVQFMSDLFCKLMRELGYEKFGVHGGDFGSGIGMSLALKFPQNIIGLHINNIESYYKPFTEPGTLLSEDEIQYEKESNEWYEKEGSYSHQQSTKPLTLAYALNDSPAGLCAWIIEKFYSWSDCKGNLENIFSKDELLANVTLYWLTETIHSSIRLYSESRNAPLIFGKNDFVKVPTAIVRLPKEDPFPPREYIERGFNIVQWTDLPAGGHFAAMEQPEALSKDIVTFFSRLK